MRRDDPTEMMAASSRRHGAPRRLRAGPRLLGLALVGVMLVAACDAAGAGPDAGAQSSAGTSVASGEPDGAEAMTPEPSMTALPADGSMADLCPQIGLLQESVRELVDVELRIGNRIALEIELGKVQAAHAELDRADLGELESQLEDPLRRLGYRLIDLEIAVEDFRTNPRPRPAAAHVEDDSSAYSDAVDGFALLARC